MLKIRKIVYTLFCIFFACSFVTVPATKTTAQTNYVIHQQWNNLTGWNTTGTGTLEINPAGELHLSTTGSDVTRVTKTDAAIPQNYSAEVRIKIASFGTEAGMAIYDGAYRVHMYFAEEGVYLRNADNVKQKMVDWSSDTGWHVYRVEVSGGVGRFFFDGTDMGTWLLNASTNSDRFEHWVKGPVRSELYVDYSRLYNIAAPVLINEPFNSLSGWTVSGSGIKEIQPAGQLRLKNTANNTVIASKKINLPDKYRVEVRYKVDAFGNDQGLTLYNGKHRMMLYFRTDGVYIRHWDNTTYKVVSWSGDTNWHIYRVDVDKGFGQVYFDGVYMDYFPLNKHTGSGEIRFFVGSTTVGEAHVDYIKVTDLSKEPSDTYTYRDNFEDETEGSDPDYWMETTDNDYHSYTQNLWTIYADGANKV